MANEVFAPTTATWAATGAGTGVAAVGIGTTMPTELAAWAPYGGTAKPLSALVFWNPNFKASLTSPAIKFGFICNLIRAGVQSDIFVGFGYCNNPSVSTSAVITAGLNPMVLPSGYAANVPAFLYRMYGSRNQILGAIQDSDVNGNGDVTMHNAAGQITVEMLSNGTDATFPYTGIVALYDQSGSPEIGQIPA